MKLEITGMVPLAQLKDNCSSIEVMRGFTRKAPPALPLGDYPASIDMEIYGGTGRVIIGENIPSVLLFCLKDVYLIMDDATGGAVITSEGQLVSELSMFTGLAHQKDKIPFVYDAGSDPIEMDAVGIGFDGAWCNYYHWLMFSLGKSNLLISQMPDSIPLGLPHPSLVNPAAPRYSAATFWSSLYNVLPRKNVVMLGRGIYKLKNLYTIWTSSYPPTDICERIELFTPFNKFINDGSCRYIYNEVEEHIFISRAKSGDPRLNDSEDSALEAIFTPRGFKSVYLEEMSFEHQVKLVNSAKIIVAPHGAGLTNLVFAQSGAVAIELNRRIGGEAAPRPWFYQIAAMKELNYFGIDMDHPLAIESLTMAIDNII